MMIIPQNKKKTLQVRDKFVLKYFMNKKAIKPGDFEDDLLYFLEHFNSAIRNGELFEQAFMALYGIEYNKELNGADGYITQNGTTFIIEAKKEMKSGDKKLDGKSAWSIHCVDTLVKKQNDPNFYLLQFGFKHDGLVYALLIKMDETTVIKGKTPHKHSKMLANWKDFKDAKEIYPLFLNKPLIKQWASADFKNWLLSLTETDPSAFGVDLRKTVGMKPDDLELFYHKGCTIWCHPKYAPNGNTCLAIPISTFIKEIIPLCTKLQLNEIKSLQIGYDTLYFTKQKPNIRYVIEDGKAVRKINEDEIFMVRASIDKTKKFREFRILNELIQNHKERINNVD